MKQKENYKNYSYCLLFFGILLRVWFAWAFRGHGDAWNTESWFEYLLDGQIPFGPPYLPTYNLFGYIFNFLVSHFGLFFSFWMKVGNILADIGIMVLLFKIANLMFKSVKLSIFTCLAYIFNPISFQLTALHGQFDQYVFFFVLLAAYIEISNNWKPKHKIIASSLALVLATFAKPYVIIFFPIFFFRRHSFKDKVNFTLIYVTGCILSLAVLNWNLIPQAVKSIVGYGQAWHYGWGRPFGKYPLIREILNNFAAVTKPFIVGLAFVFGYLGRKRNVLLPILMIILATYIVSPTLGSQYLYWVIPIGVLFIDKFFCLYSVLGFVWQLNFFQNSVINGHWYGEYIQFVPLVSLSSLYNFWLFPRWLNMLLMRVNGDIIIPILIIIWFISLIRRYDFKLSFSKDTFKGMFKSIFEKGQPELNQSSSRGNLILLITLLVVTISWIAFTGAILSNVGPTSSSIISRHYPQDIEFKGRKIDQYFLHGRNQELVEEFQIKESGVYRLRIETPELYKVYINDQFLVFNWAPGYGVQFGTNRTYKKVNSFIDISHLIHLGKNKIKVIANFSFEDKGRNYTKIEIVDESGTYLLNKREDLELISQRPFYLSLPAWLSFISLFYFLFSCRKVIVEKGS